MRCCDPWIIIRTCGCKGDLKSIRLLSHHKVGPGSSYKWGEITHIAHRYLAIKLIFLHGSGILWRNGSTMNFVIDLDWIISKDCRPFGERHFIPTGVTCSVLHGLVSWFVSDLAGWWLLVLAARHHLSSRSRCWLLWRGHTIWPWFPVMCQQHIWHRHCLQSVVQLSGCRREQPTITGLPPIWSWIMHWMVSDRRR